MVTTDFGLRQPQKPCRVVVENVALLRVAEERGTLDAADGRLDDTRPHHLIRSEHHTVAESGLDDPPEIAVELRLGERPHERANFGVHLPVCPHQREQVVDERPSRMHDVDTQLRMLQQQIFELQCAMEPGAVVWKEVRGAWRPRADVNADRNVERFREGEIGLESRIVCGDTRVLIRDLGKNSELSVRVQRCHAAGRHGVATDLEAKPRYHAIWRVLPPSRDAFRRPAEHAHDIPPVENLNRLRTAADGCGESRAGRACPQRGPSRATCVGFAVWSAVMLAAGWLLAGRGARPPTSMMSVSVGMRGDQQQLWIRRLDRTEATPIAARVW